MARSMKLFRKVKCEKTINVLPTEILTKIFGYLKIKELILCEHVCQRWKLTISNDLTLWSKTKVNLLRKQVPISFLNKIICQGVKYLSLQHGRVKKDNFIIKNEESNQLTHLNFFDTQADKGILEEFLKSCQICKN